MEANNKEIDAVFADKAEITIPDFLPICQRVFKFPKFLNPLIFRRIDTTGKGKITKEQLMRVWEDDYERQEVSKRMFKIMTRPDSKYLTNEDFKPILKELLNSHPGLNFLEATPEFQDRYADTVVMRIFYGIDTNDDGRISYRDFK